MKEANTQGEEWPQVGKQSQQQSAGRVMAEGMCQDCLTLVAPNSSSYLEDKTQKLELHFCPPPLPRHEQFPLDLPSS